VDAINNVHIVEVRQTKSGMEHLHNEDLILTATLGRELHGCEEPTPDDGTLKAAHEPVREHAFGSAVVCDDLQLAGPPRLQRHERMWPLTRIKTAGLYLFSGPQLDELAGPVRPIDCRGGS
jgi:hypothetical protein